MNLITKNKINELVSESSSSATHISIYQLVYVSEMIEVEIEPHSIRVVHQGNPWSFLFIFITVK